MHAVRDALNEGMHTLQNAEIETARLDARLLLEQATGQTRERLIAELERPLSPEEWQTYQRLIKRRTQREPIAQLLGRKEFWSLDFTVTRATLTPRPDSETLIEVALAWIANRAAPLKILDLGTGSGCLLLALLSELPSATGVGVDISEEALRVARANAEAQGVAKRTLFARSDWGKAVEGTFDLILSNPPYIAASEMAQLSPEVAQFEPRHALDGGADGLQAYRALAPDIHRLLSPKGKALLEVGVGQAAEVAMIMEKAGLFRSAIHRDLAGKDRCVGITHKPITRKPITRKLKEQ